MRVITRTNINYGPWRNIASQSHTELWHCYEFLYKAISSLRKKDSNGRTQFEQFDTVDHIFTQTHKR